MLMMVEPQYKKTQALRWLGNNINDLRILIRNTPAILSYQTDQKSGNYTNVSIIYNHTRYDIEIGDYIVKTEEIIQKMDATTFYQLYDIEEEGGN